MRHNLTGLPMSAGMSVFHRPPGHPGSWLRRPSLLLPEGEHVDAGADAGAGDGGGQVPPAGGQVPPAGNGRGFPENTPWRDMTADQQVAYWQHQARKHEATVKARSDYDALRAKAQQWDEQVASQQTPSEQALEQARREAREKTLNEVNVSTARRVVAAEFRAALAGRRKADEVAALLEPLDLTKFLTADGEVDTDKVTNYAAGLAPVNGSGLDMGQGSGRGGHLTTSKRDAGLAEAERRFGKKHQ